MKKTDEVWNIMTRTRGGTVSLLKNLTEDQARNAMQRLRRPFDEGDPWDIDRRISRERQARKAGARGDLPSMGGWYIGSDGDLEQVECWGPPGAKLVVWPKPDDWDERWAEALAKLDAEDAALTETP